VLEDHEEPAHSSADGDALLADLKAELKRAVADSLRHATEKAEVLRRADTASRERDDLKDRIDALSQEKDSLAREVRTLSGALARATGDAEKVLREVERLSQELLAQRSAKTLEVLWGLVCRDSAAGVAFLRSKIPAGHPSLKWFDFTVELTVALGCVAYESTVIFFRWAKPVAKDLWAKFLAFCPVAVEQGATLVKAAVPVAKDQSAKLAARLEQLLAKK